MKVLNPMLLNQNNISNKNIVRFLQDSINRIVIYNDSIGVNMEEKNDYRLFKIILESVYQNVYALQGWDFDQYDLNFTNIRFVTRRAVEAYVDLFNLTQSSDYIEVMKSISKYQNKFNINQKYWGFRTKAGNYTFASKVLIAKKLHGEDLSHLNEVFSECSSYVHSDIFVPQNNYDESIKNEGTFCSLLITNINVLIDAYNIIKNKYFCGQQPHLGCVGCKVAGCYGCYSDLLTKFNNILIKNLIVDIKERQYNYL